METVTLLRTSSREDGTFGVLLAPKMVALRTLELPDKGNRKNVSCIPTGIYQVSFEYSKKFDCHYYLVKNVPRRSGIFFHSGVFAGSTGKGYNSHSKGCVLLGKYSGRINGQLGLIDSKKSIEKFNERMNQNDFQLRIAALYRR